MAAGAVVRVWGMSASASASAAQACPRPGRNLVPANCRDAAIDTPPIGSWYRSTERSRASPCAGPCCSVDSAALHHGSAAAASPVNHATSARNDGALPCASRGDRNRCMQRLPRAAGCDQGCDPRVMSCASPRRTSRRASRGLSCRIVLASAHVTTSATRRHHTSVTPASRRPRTLGSVATKMWNAARGVHFALLWCSVRPIAEARRRLGARWVRNGYGTLTARWGHAGFGTAAIHGARGCVGRRCLVTFAPQECASMRTTSASRTRRCDITATSRRASRCPAAHPAACITRAAPHTVTARAQQVFAVPIFLPRPSAGVVANTPCSGFGRKTKSGRHLDAGGVRNEIAASNGTGARLVRSCEHRIRASCPPHV